MPRFHKRQNLSLIYGFLGGLSLSSLLMFFAMLIFSPHAPDIEENGHYDAQVIIKNRILLNRRISNIGTNKEGSSPKVKENGKHYTPGNGRHRVEPNDLRNERIENFLADEVHAKRLIYFGMLASKTSKEYKSLWDTWGSEIEPRDIGFFTGASSSVVSGSSSQVENSDFIPLSDVPVDRVEGAEHLVSALQYICSHLIDSYQWYYLSRPNIYVNRETLHQLLQRLKGSDPHMIGRPLSDMGSTQCCDVNQGLLMSHMLVQKMCPYLSHCLPYTAETSSHRFTFLEKCTQDFIGVTGARAVEIDSLFQDSTKIRNSKEPDAKIQSAAIIGPLENTKEFYSYHRKYLLNRMRNITEGLSGMIKIKEEVLKFGQTLDKIPNLLARSHGGTDFWLDFPTQTPVNQLKHWHIVAQSESLPGPTTCYNHKMQFYGQACCKAQSYIQEYLQTEGDYRYIKTEAMYSGNSNELQCHVHYEQASLSKLKYGVATVSHRVGKTYPISKDKLKSGDQQTYHFIVAVQEGSTTFRSFLKSFHEACTVPNHLSCALIVVMYKGDANSNIDIEIEIANHKQRTSNSHVVLLDMTEMLLSCSHALKVSRTLLNPGDLVFYVSENTVINQNILNHCSTNILSDYQIYSPLPKFTNDTHYYLQNIVHRTGPVFCILQNDLLKLHSKLKMISICSSDYLSIKTDLNYRIIRAYDSDFYLYTNGLNAIS